MKNGEHKQYVFGCTGQNYSSEEQIYSLKDEKDDLTKAMTFNVLWQV